jgi:hypothetical protein
MNFLLALDEHNCNEITSCFIIWSHGSLQSYRIDTYAHAKWSRFVSIQLFKTRRVDNNELRTEDSLMSLFIQLVYFW